MVSAPPESPQTQLGIEEEPAKVTFFLEPLAEGVELDMVQIPEGEFDMGSPPEELDRTEAEGPVHHVQVPSFWMSSTPITQAQWRVVAGFEQAERELEPDPSNFKGDNRPVERVSWEDAVEFCQRLANHTQLPYRLPSEAEWEYACRAYTTTPFYFGETITTDLANYRGTDHKINDTTTWLGYYGRGPRGEYREETTPVGQLNAPNQFGLHDMYGNVWEWCLDCWHENYDGAPTDGTAWTESEDNEYVLRGGSWFHHPGVCRSACRARYSPGSRYNGLGFRIVCAPRGLP
ncbi:MAG: formylglycine-generating enzyme family protein [Cyanobacteria bacterium P01_G01_bin.54]